jgi:glutathione S-transferase
MLTLFHSPQTRSSRMIWLLEELGADYTIQRVDIRSRMRGTGAPDPANPHPDKQVPALLDDGVLISESVAVALYLCEKFPAAGLAPPVGDPLRGPWLTWMAWYGASMEPSMFAIFAGEADKDPLKREAVDNMHRRLLEALRAGPYLLGDTFSAIDLFVSSAGEWARRAFPDDPLVDAYIERCTARPALARARAKDGTP